MLKMQENHGKILWLRIRFELSLSHNDNVVCKYIITNFNFDLLEKNMWTWLITFAFWFFFKFQSTVIFIMHDVDGEIFVVF